jgi:hypothetical protein
VRVEHTHVHELGARRDAAVVLAGHLRRRAGGARDDAGDVRAVAVCVIGRRIAGHEADAREDLVRQRRMRGDPRIDDSDDDALAGDARNREEAEQAAAAGARLVGGGRCVGDRHRRCDQQIAREMFDGRVGGERRDLRAIGAEHCSAGQPPYDVQAVARGERGNLGGRSVRDDARP